MTSIYDELRQKNLDLNSKIGMLERQMMARDAQYGQFLAIVLGSSMVADFIMVIGWYLW